MQLRGHALQRSVAEARRLGSTQMVEALGSWASSWGACCHFPLLTLEGSQVSSENSQSRSPHSS